jgi:hypothetical protein
MKKIIFKTTVVYLAVVSTFALSCNKKPAQSDPSQIIQPSTPEINYEEKYDKIIETVGYGLIDLSNNSSFQNIVNTQVHLKFDKDDNVLLKKISSECAAIGLDLKQLMKDALIKYNKQDHVIYVDEAIEGFTYFDSKLYPQVYIPFITNKDLTKNPKICLDPNGEEILAGLVLNNNSIVTEKVSETYARNNLVWVISVNETVTAEGLLPRPSAQNTSNIGKKTRAVDRLLKMDKINVQDKKEAWGHGKGEISYAVISVISPCTKDGSTAKEAFEKVGNSQLNIDCFANNFSGNIQFADLSNPPVTLWRENETLKVLFYEHDVRKSFLQNTQLFVNCSNTMVDFVSKEPMYGIVTPGHSEYPFFASTLQTYSLTGMSVTLSGNKN